LGFLYALSPLALSIVALIGGLTAVVAATIGITPNDFKKVLAYSTVSQLGYMFVGVGVGAYGAGIFHVFTHAFFKACLFLGSGAVLHALHNEQDIRRMGGLRKVMPWTFWTFVIATLALAGVPPLAGFFSKDAILWEALSRHNEVWPWLPRFLWVLLVAGAFMTAFYMWRLVSLVFLGEFRGPHSVLHHAHEAPWAMRMPLVVLAICSIGVGFFGVPHFLGGSNKIEHWLEPAVTAGYVASEHESDSGHETTGGEHEVAHESAAAEWGATAVALAAGLGGLALGHFFYRVRPDLPAKVAARVPAVYRLLAGKYFVDEIYGALIVRPFQWLSDRILWRIIDVRMIDGLVNLLAGFTKAFSYLFRFFQSGYVQTYVLVVVLGVLALLLRAI
jgi:NADH-quinone oxidoreductase subunit L